MRTRRYGLHITSLVLAILIMPLGFFMLSASGQQGTGSVLYSNDFETNSDGWSHGGAKDEWELGTPIDGPGYCHSGSKCWGTDLDDDYETEANEFLLSPSLDLTQATSATLDYWQYYNITNFLVVDIGFLEISKDAGSSYTAIYNVTGNSSQMSWEHTKVSLKSYLGFKVLVRFRLVTNQFWPAPGWYLDDFQVLVNETGSGTDDRDLATININYSPSPPNAGQSTTVVVYVENRGAQDEKGAKVKLSIQDINDKTTVYTQTLTIDYIAKGATVKVEFYWKPGYSAAFELIGSVFIEGDKDTRNDVFRTKAMVGSFPHNLAIVEMVSNPKEPKVGTPTTISVTVKNLGSSEEKRIRVQIRITTSTDALVLEEGKPIEALEPNTIRTVEFTWTPSAADLYIARANANLKDDPTPDDNRAEIYILVTKKGIDLAVTGLLVRPRDGGPGMRRTIDATVMNIGDVDATAVTVYYEVIFNGAVKFQDKQAYSTFTSGEVKQVLFDIVPDTPGVYNVHVWVTAAADGEPDNDAASATFTVRSAYRDVGIESITASPRAGEVGIPRSIQAEVGNYGDIAESFRTTIRVMDPADAEVLTKDFELNLQPGQRSNITTGWTPATYGNYSITATTYLGQDAQSSNDVMATTFVATKHQVHDMGLEVLDVTPRTGFLDVNRAITATVANLGDTLENGEVAFMIFDMSGGLKTNFTRPVSIAAGARTTVEGNFIPGSIGTFSVRARVNVQGATDQEPSNDEMNQTFISEARPPSVDLYIEALASSQVPGLVGKELELIVLVGNHGIEPASGQLLLTVTDPSKKVTDQVQNVDVRPGMAVEFRFLYSPQVAGDHTISARVTYKGSGTDANATNDVATLLLKVTDTSAKDVAVLSVVPSKKAQCGFSFDIRSSIQNKGTASAAGIKVTLEVSGNGQSYTKDQTIDLDKGQTKDVMFNYTAPRSGVYTFVVRIEAAGDQQHSNDVLSAQGEACDPAAVDTRTSVQAGIASWALALILVIIAVVLVVMYEYSQERKRQANEALQGQAGAGHVTAPLPPPKVPSTPRQGAQPQVRRPSGPSGGGRRPLR